MISFKYALTEEDYKNFVAYVLWEGNHNRKKRRRYYLRQLIPLAAFLFAFYYTGTFERTQFIYLALGMLVVTGILSFTGVRTRFTREAERYSADPDNRSVFAEKQVSIGDEGLRVKDEFSENNYQWKAFVKKEENTDYYFLFLSSNFSLIIPKRVFRDPLEKTAVDKMLSRHISFDAEFADILKS